MLDCRYGIPALFQKGLGFGVYHISCRSWVSTDPVLDVYSTVFGEKLRKSSFEPWENIGIMLGFSWIHRSISSKPVIFLERGGLAFPLGWIRQGFHQWPSRLDTACVEEQWEAWLMVSSSHQLICTVMWVKHGKTTIHHPFRNGLYIIPHYVCSI